MINPAKNSFHTSHKPWGHWLRNVSESSPYVIFKDKRDGSTRKLYRSAIRCQCCGSKYHGCSGWHLCSVCDETFCLCCHKSPEEHQKKSAEVDVSQAENNEYDDDEGYSIQDFIVIAIILFALISYFARSSGTSESISYSPSVNAADNEVLQDVTDTVTPITMREVQPNIATKDDALVMSEDAEGQSYRVEESIASEKPGVNQVAIQRMLDHAVLQYERNNFENALFTLNNVLLFDSDNQMANELKEKVELALENEVNKK